MAEDLTPEQLDDAVAAAIWANLPPDARRDIQSRFSGDERNQVAKGIQNGRRIIRGRQE